MASSGNAGRKGGTMTFSFDAITVFGALGLAFSLASFIMKRMLPLRMLAIGANIAFIAFALAMLGKPGIDPRAPLPGLLLNVILLPINGRRVWEIRKLTSEISRATRDSPVSQWLLPHMQRRGFAAGDVLFRKGDPADKLIYIASGDLTLVEIAKPLGAGELLGEIGLFSPDNRRTQTLRADSAGELYEMTGEMLFQLYYQNPKLGFYMMRLLTERLLRDVQRQAQPA
jgi:CRP/FNR family cyclic AMP-dependent transcriptional regulator